MLKLRIKNKKRFKRVAVALPIVVAMNTVLGKILVYLAYQERGYSAIGGEWAAILMLIAISFLIFKRFVNNADDAE